MGREKGSDRFGSDRKRGRMNAWMCGRGGYILLSLLCIAVMWACWLIVYRVVDNDYVVASFTDTMKEVGALLVSSVFWKKFSHTMIRTLIGWSASFVCGIAFASLAALSRGFRSFFAPFVSVLRIVPTMAITVMLMVWSSPRVAPAIVCFLMQFPIIYSQILGAYESVDPQLLEMAKVYGVSKGKILAKIILPGVLPSVLSQVGANISLSLKVTVSAEVLSGTFTSLGYMMQESAMYLRIAEMFALTLIAILAGGLIEFGFGFLTKITDRWKKGARS